MHAAKNMSKNLIQKICRTISSKDAFEFVLYNYIFLIFIYDVYIYHIYNYNYVCSCVHEAILAREKFVAFKTSM